MQSTIYILMRNDDPGPLSDPVKERRVLAIFEKYHIPQVLAVIPNNVDDPHNSKAGKLHPLEENPEIVNILREYTNKGLVEIATHGYTHQTNRFRPTDEEKLAGLEPYKGISGDWLPFNPKHEDGYSEFNGLPVEEQREKIDKGKEHLEKVFNMKFDSFIFPWNAYNKDVLRLLRQRGYKYVPGEDDKYIFPGICVIGCCNWDWEVARFRKLINEAEKLNKPVFTQFAYHSWEISEEFMRELDKLLFEVSSKKHIVFLMPNQIPQFVPWLPGIIKLRSIAVKIEREILKYADKKIASPKYYVKDYGFYLWRIVALLWSLFLVKVLRIGRATMQRRPDGRIYAGYNVKSSYKRT